MDNMQEQLDQVTDQVTAMSAVSANTHAGSPSPPTPQVYSSQTSIPPVIQTNHNSNTSALGTADQTFRVLMEERNRFDKDRAALQHKHNSETAALHNGIKALERLTNSS